MMKRNTKKALLTSLLSLLLCFSMLVGTTFAWFTDSVVSGINTIAAGNLDVDVYYGDPALEQSITGVSTLFTDVALWEPGAVAYENLTVVNLGSLALKYQMNISFANANSVLVDGQPVYSLPQILKIGLVPGGVDKALGRDAIVNSVTQWYTMESYALENTLLANTSEKTMGVVVWWQPSDDDNNWNLNNDKVTDDGADYLHVDLGLTLVATQLTAESDSFDDQYDDPAEYPKGVTVYPGDQEDKILTQGRVTVIVPAGSPAGYYTLEMADNDYWTRTGDNVSMGADFAVCRDGVVTDDVEYPVQLRVDTMSTIHKVTHNGEEILDYTYDPFADVVSFKTKSFSPFAVEYTIFGEEVEMDAANRKIFGGFYKGVNPVSLDASLADGTYMVVDFEKNGTTVYAVSEAATTVILGDADDGGVSGYNFVNGNYPVKLIADNQLYAEISALQNNANSTVYLLPGTYDEATTVNVYSSMDIIGLGDAEDVKVTKVGCHSNTSKKPSNRHLFNCNGSKADYIEVTIRNLQLDATEQNSYIGKLFGKEQTRYEDNAAVQSIRKTKVKCYDLNIVKGTNTSGVAFYVNGNNAVDGVKYTAYMYAENCSLDVARSFGVVSTAGSYQFWHSGLTYNGTAYTNNSGNNKNCELRWDNWNWTAE